MRSFSPLLVEIDLGNEASIENKKNVNFKSMA